MRVGNVNADSTNEVEVVMRRVGFFLAATVLLACHPRGKRAAESPAVWHAESIVTDIPDATAAGNLNFSMPARATRLVAIRDWMLGLPRPEYLPPYSALAADPEGILWASLSFPGDTTTLLRGVQQDGTAIADIVIHTGMSVLEVGMDYVLGIEEDPSGELHVVVRYLGRSLRAARVSPGHSVPRPVRPAI